MLNRAIAISILLFLSLQTQAQKERAALSLNLDNITITGKRPLADIGVQKSLLDTTILRENITNSLADVLAQNSSIFIKSYGRATLSTASFRGTSPSHTQVTWNDMKLNSPMLGMVDFSMIPSYFIDEGTIYHGASSTSVAAGGLGGAIKLTNQPSLDKGFSLRYVQGIGSYQTFDEFLRLGYSSKRWQSSTRLYFASSKNNYKYTNYRKKIPVKDESGNTIVTSYPTERNKNGSYKDFHVMQELYYQTKKGARLGLMAWFTDSKRGVPMLNVDYKEEGKTKNQQDEQTLRSVASIDKLKSNYRLSGKLGYTYTNLRYIYGGELGGGVFQEMIHSQSYVHTAFAKADAEYYLAKKWVFTLNLAAHQHFIKSSDRAIVSQSGVETIIGYDKARLELSGLASVKYRPTDRLGLAINLREEFYGTTFAPIIPALLADYLLSKKGNITLRASVARNYRYPSLNDLYFMPGGNDSLKAEKGFTVDAGIDFLHKTSHLSIEGGLSAYNSNIDDWIVWLPTFKGFWSPVNVKKVHSYGMELKAKLEATLHKNWQVAAGGNFSIAHSINQGDPQSWADESIGKQLVYVPVYSSSANIALTWNKSWKLSYKWNYYSERYTTSSNEKETKIGLLTPYFMNDISLEKRLSAKWANFSISFAINNLFNEEYESVLSRPMPKRNFGLYLEISPKIVAR